MHRSRRGALLLAWLLPLAALAAAPVPTEVVRVDQGRLQGELDRGVSAFRGIPYGAPPVGELRFAPPLPAPGWAGILPATHYGASAMQLYDRTIETPLSWQISQLFPTQEEKKSDSENSLFLNVWTPAPDGRARPVLVWFHGGGWAYGSGSWPVYDGANLARRGDVVVVTVNHRLNVFGYLHLEGIGGEAWAGSGNAGLLDMVLALEWVRDNIGAFGGDPGNVTIMGESGGGSKVSHLMATPAAAGLFHKAIVQSGPGLEAVPADAATRTARAIVQELGVGEEELERLRTLPAETILAAAEAVVARLAGEGARLQLSPVVDGEVLPRHPFTPDAPRQARDIPLLIGWNKDEFTIFNASAPWFGRLTRETMIPQLATMVGGMERAVEVADAYGTAYPDYSPTYLFNMILGDQRMALGSVVLAERKARQRAPVWMYYLTWETPVGGGVLKAPHTLDMPLMFANVDRSHGLTGASTEAYRLERMMASSWIAFAHTGDPNNDAVPDWPAWKPRGRAAMVFDVEPQVVEDPKGELLELLRRE